MADARLRPEWLRKAVPECQHEEADFSARRLDQHEAAYVKPRPLAWWDWHCAVCNAPTGDPP